jgi:hypothetical protein
VNPAEELRSAAFALRNPIHSGGPAIGVDEEVRRPLANWLDQTADLIDALPAITATNHALAVARALNGSTS